MSLKFSFKICITGEPGVGKTSLIIRYMENKFRENYIPTLGVDFLQKKIEIGENKVPVNLIIWDIGGGYKWKSRLNFYLKGSDGAIVIYDITRRSTFNKLDEWINRILKHAGKVPLMIIGNKKDLEELRKIQIEEALSHLKNKNVVNILETSAKTGDTVNEMFYKIAENIVIQKAKNLKS